MNSNIRRELLPVTRIFYESEGFKLARPNSKGWSVCQGQPPCHESRSGKSFSVNVNSGGFYCHGCKTGGGDVIAFTRLRYNLGFAEACQRVGCWDDAPSPETIRRIDEDERDRRLQKLAEEQAADERQRDCLEIRDHLHAALTIQREIENPGEGDEELNRLLERYIRKVDGQYCEAAGLEQL